MDFNIEYEQEEDGRWLAEVSELPGVLAYGETADKAMVKVEALALRVIAERLEHEECRPMSIDIFLVAACVNGHRSKQSAYWLRSCVSVGRLRDKQVRTKPLSVQGRSRYCPYAG